MTDLQRTTIRLSTALLCAAILVLAQLLISQWTVRAASNQEVVSYVSFAGTLTSLLLAVLAIVYSYFTTASQKSDADRLSAHLSSLTQTISTLDTSGAKFDVQLERLGELSQKIDGVATTVEARGREAADAQARMERLLEEAKSQKQTDAEEVPLPAGTQRNPLTARTATTIAGDEQFEFMMAAKIGSGALASQCPLLLAAYFNVKHDKGLSDDLDTYVMPFVTAKPTRDRQRYYGEMYGYVMVLIDVGLSADDAVQRHFLAALLAKITRIGRDDADDRLDWTRFYDFALVVIEKELAE